MSPDAWSMLEQEARSLLTRLARVRPFALIEPMVPAAALLPAAQSAIERYLASGRRELHALVGGFRHWLREARASASDEEAQRKFVFLRLRFNAILTQFDLFADVITQRSENENGVWLGGLDAVASDALNLPGRPYTAPPVVCYLDRGPGAAIRRARTRLPGGGANPVAIIRVPRERMVGSGVASSLVHEVGHQGAALLDLVNTLRPLLQERQRALPHERSAWQLWERWISEIVADVWAIGRVGFVATLGLIAVVSLPRVFVFRLNADDPHPIPWLRVLLGCAIGEALYPHSQWQRLARTWESCYPAEAEDAPARELLALLRRTMPDFVRLMVTHRPPLLGGRSLAEALETGARQPRRLGQLFDRWSEAPTLLYHAPPTLAFAVLGQARSDGRLSPEQENVLLARLLTHWALRSAVDTATACAGAANPTTH